MAGLFGVSTASIENSPQLSGSRMAALLSHRDGQQTLKVDRERMTAGVVTAISGRGGGHLKFSDDVDVFWVGQPALLKNGATLAGELENLCHELARKEGSPSRILSQIDGPFAFCICDHQAGLAYLLNDKFGGLPIYWSHGPGVTRWASEVKCLAKAGSKSRPLNIEAMQNFLERGYVPPDQTYYCEVKQLGSFEILKINLKSSEYGISIWQRDDAFRDIDPDNISIGEAIPLFLDRARLALRRRLDLAGSGRVYVTLSGGLDSRFLLALAKEAGADLGAVTYGQAGAVEVEIASEVARVLDVPHIVVPISQANWLENRDRAVWMTDGMMDLTHTHIVHTAPALEDASLVLDGLFGDVVLGRGAITLDPALSEAENRYLRMNRFTYFGPRIEMNFAPVATPLIDTELVALMDALPSSLTEGGRLYREAAYAVHPEVHRGVAWHKSGSPPYPYQSLHSGENWRKARKRVMQALSWMGAPTGRRYFTMDYTRWCRSENFMRLVEHAVYGSGGQLRQLLPLPNFRTIFSPIPNARNAVLPARLLTLELWLRQQSAGAGLTWQELEEAIGHESGG